MKKLIHSIKLTPWFTVNSWRFIVTKSWRSKVEYFTGYCRAWYIFMQLENKPNKPND